MAEQAKYVADFLKQHDRDRYLSTLILNDPQRDAVQALYAFNADVAAIPLRVSEPGPGEIRLQWWKDTLEGAGHGDVNQNPIAAAFLEAVQNYSLPTGPLVRLIAARRFDLYQDPMPDMETFEGYAGETSSVLYQFAAMILDGGKPLENGDAAGHLGVAHALIGHLRSLGYNAARGRIFLPWAIFEANGVSEQQLFSGQETDGVRKSAEMLRDIATDYLARASKDVAEVSRKVRPVFAMASILRAQLAILEKSKHEPLHTPKSLPDWQKILKLAF